jgi:ketosteroid isomerase-like protein
VTEENERLIREGYAALNNQDLEWMRAHAHPDFEFTSRFSGLSGRIYKGPTAFEQWHADVSESWESIE